MLTPNLLTLQGYYFWKDVAFWNNFSNDSIKTMVSFNLGLHISFFTLPYTTKKRKPGLGLRVCVNKGGKNHSILMVLNPILFDKHICFLNHMSVCEWWNFISTSLKAKNNVPYSKLWPFEDFLRKKSDICHHWY